MTEPDHPLTARVAVNRHWQLFFGTGLVKTAEDFGVQGEKPSHPELLDWLATDFVRHGWDTKHLHRLIVTSATYRQSARVSADLAARDPDNRLLARGPRYRLPAWMLRDQVAERRCRCIYRVFICSLTVDASRKSFSGDLIQVPPAYEISLCRKSPPE